MIQLSEKIQLKNTVAYSACIRFRPFQYYYTLYTCISFASIASRANSFSTF